MLLQRPGATVTTHKKKYRAASPGVANGEVARLRQTMLSPTLNWKWEDVEHKRNTLFETLVEQVGVVRRG